MATSVPFYLIDVFAEQPLTGNPLAVVDQADRIDETLWPLIAREFNQSETTFLLPSAHATWKLRSFTPAGEEVVGAGHNSLGAWWWLAHAGRLALDGAAGRFTQELGGKVLPVEVVPGGDGRPAHIVLDQTAPRFGEPLGRPPELAAALSLSTDDLHSDMPVQVVDTGQAHLLVPIADRAAVDRAQPDAGRLRDFLRSAGAQGCYLASLDPPSADADAYTRFFNPTVGIWEDPATGSAAGPLACLLVAAGVIEDGATVTVDQGRAMGRPSRLSVEVVGEKVRLRGGGVLVAEGMIHL